MKAEEPAVPGGRFALLIATGSYDDLGLRKLRSPVRDAEDLAHVLRDPLIGDFEVDMVVDGRNHEVNRVIEQFFLDRGRDDLLLLHVSCHGIKNNNGELHFAARDTDRRLLASTAVSAAFLQTQMRRCRARSIVLLLDCCYSGAFLPGIKGDTTVHVKAELAGHGRAVLTATNRTEYAWEGDHLNEMQPEPSMFTGTVIKGLRSGEADGDQDGLISVNDLHEYVCEQLRAASAKQSPQMWAEVEYQVVVAQSVLPSRQNEDHAQYIDRTRAAVAGGPSRSLDSSRLDERATRLSGIGLITQLTEALSELGCMEDARSRLFFVSLLGDQLGRNVDLRGVKLREDVVTIVRAALKATGGERVLVNIVGALEGLTAAAELERLLDSASLPSGPVRVGGGADHGIRREEAGVGSSRPDDRGARLSGIELLLQLTEALSQLGCMEDSYGRMLFTSLLGEQLGQQVEVHGGRLREDVATMARAALNVPGGERALTNTVRLIAGSSAGDEFERLVASSPPDTL